MAIEKNIIALQVAYLIYIAKTYRYFVCKICD